MADIKISQLGAAIAVGDTDLMPIVSGGNTLKATAAQVKEHSIGNTNISSIGDGSVTGAISELNTDKQPKTLATPLTIGGVSKTTVEDALGGLVSENQTLTNNKLDKSGGTLTGNLNITKTTSGAVTVTYNNPSTSKANVASIFADNEGGNLSLSKENNTGRIQIDTQPMNGSTGYGRLMLGDSSSVARKVFRFNEDGSFTDGNGVNTKTLNDSLTKRTAVLNGKTFSMTAANRTIPNYTPGKKYCIVIFIDPNGDSNGTTCVSQEFIGSDIINQLHIMFGNGFVGNIYIDILTSGAVQLENAWKISGTENEYVDLSTRYFSVYEIS